MSEPRQDPSTTPDPDADPGHLNPRDTRGTGTEDGARADRDVDPGAEPAEDPDADPDALNPRVGQRDGRAEPHS